MPFFFDKGAIFMGYSRVLLLPVWVLTPWLTALCPATDLFRTREEKQGFLKALRRQDARYDPKEKMIRRPFSSPGYHTALKGGYVHPTRDSLEYAVALLDSGDPNRAERAEDILRKVISLQDQDPSSRTYGIWSWFMEEPLQDMSPPDWNWADFCGTQLLQVALDHRPRLPKDLRQQVKDSILHAARSIRRRNVGPGYTNIAVMGTYVTLVAGELFQAHDLKAYGKARLQRFYDYTVKHGSFHEYNSPTYSVVAIRELTRMLQHVRDPEAQELLRELNRLAWYHVGRHFHPPTRQWAGPHSRCYSTLLRKRALAFIQRATDGRVRFLPEQEVFESLDAHRIRPRCPEDFFHYFVELAEPRTEVEAFARSAAGKHDIIGTTYLHPDFALGSVNLGDLWNQRRPLLAYWNTDDGVVTMRLRCLHDGYDYASASIFAVQDKGDILSAVVFATDRGDTHISLDRIKDATIKAKDVRLRLQFEGAVSHLEVPSKVQLGRPFCISSGPISCGLQVAHAVFGDHPIKLETGSGDDAVWVDLVLYHGPEKEIRFAQLKQAAIIFALSLSPPNGLGASERRNELFYRNYFHFTVVQDSRDVLIASWHRTARRDMSVSVPIRPSGTSRQRNLASAERAGMNPWKAPH